MGDLISRQDVLHELDWCDYGLKDWQKWKLKMMVRDIPLSQPELIEKTAYIRGFEQGRTQGMIDTETKQQEIIRCKDCKYYVVHTMFGRSEGWCERMCDEVDKFLAYVTELDDFCSRAERKEDKTWKI